MKREQANRLSSRTSNRGKVANALNVIWGVIASLLFLGGIAWCWLQVLIWALHGGKRDGAPLQIEPVLLWSLLVGLPALILWGVIAYYGRRTTQNSVRVTESAVTLDECVAFFEREYSNTDGKAWARWGGIYFLSLVVLVVILAALPSALIAVPAFIIGCLFAGVPLLRQTEKMWKAARHYLESPFELEYMKLCEGFNLVLKSNDLEVSAELCEVMRLLQGKCAAISAFTRRPDVIVESEQEDPEAFVDRGFPWEDVDACRNDWLQRRFNAESTINQFGEQAVCSSCGRTGRQLTWCYFISPDGTWEYLCGRAGWLVLCDHCHRQVLFICDALN